MTAEQRSCQNCKDKFTVEPEDFAFYGKLGVPAPTFCPDCRMQRRFAWRNERTFHRTTCALTDKKIISGFAPSSGMVVYDRDVWWSDAWDALAYGAEYDFSRPFFVQFDELMHRVPMPAVFNARTVNSEYSNHTGDTKDAYLVAASWGSENITYATLCSQSKDCMDVLAAMQSELCYQDVALTKCYRTFFSQNCGNCADSYFLFECKGCTDCFGCSNLRNKSHHIFNQPYSKEKYFARIKELRVDRHTSMEKIGVEFSRLKLQAIRKYANILNSPHATGDNIVNSFNAKQCFDLIGDVKDCKFIMNGIQLKDSYDGYGVGISAELLYEVFDCGLQGSRQCFGGIIYGGSNVYYSYNCHGSSNLFGCVGLRQKEYCIFNKQYDKETFNALRRRIIEQMQAIPYRDAKGRAYAFGEFFPSELSPFGYNETVAQDYFPLTKQEIENRGFQWRDPETSSREPTMRADDLPDSVNDALETITNEIIGCAECKRPYRIIPKELSFLKRFGIALPRICHDCRYRSRIQLRNPLKTWHRACACFGKTSKNLVHQNAMTHFHNENPCPNEFETPHAPDRPEIVYCEQCYQAEVA